MPNSTKTGQNGRNQKRKTQADGTDWLSKNGYGANGQAKGKRQKLLDPARSTDQFTSVDGGYKRAAHVTDDSFSQRTLTLMAAQATGCGDLMEDIFRHGVPTGRDLPADELVAHIED